MIRALTSSLAGLLLALPALGAEDHPHQLSTFGAGTFTFLDVGHTGQEQVLREIGKPAAEYDLKLVAGDIDLTVSSASSDSDAEARAKLAGRPAVTVHVMEWKGEEGGTARLVFRGGRLYYALLPITPSESTVSRITSRYGRAPSVSTQHRAGSAGERTVTLYAYPGEGVAYLQGDKDGPEAPFSAKAIFPPGARL